MSVSFSCPHCGHFTEVADEYVGRSGPCAGCGRTITIPAGDNPFPQKPVVVEPSAAAPVSRGSNLPLTLVIVLGCGCLCLMGSGILVALLLPAVQAAREAARRMQCSNNLKQIGLAMHNYHDVYRSLPPGYVTDEDGEPMHSWRIYLLPFMDQNALYEQYKFDEPWDSPNNLRLAATMPDVFKCPSSPMGGPGADLTHYVVVLDDPEPEQTAESMFGGDRATGFGEVRDGLSNTLMVAEAKDPVPWTKPAADLYFDEMDFRINGGPNSLGSYHPGGLNALFGDGSIRFLSSSIREDLVRLLIQPSDGTPIPQHEL